MTEGKPTPIRGTVDVTLPRLEVKATGDVMFRSKRKQVKHEMLTLIDRQTAHYEAAAKIGVELQRLQGREDIHAPDITFMLPALFRNEFREQVEKLPEDEGLIMLRLAPGNSGMIEAVANTLAGGALSFYDGDRPARVDESLGLQVLLATVPLASFWIDGDSAIARGVDAVPMLADGIVTWARFTGPAGDAVADATVGTTDEDIRVDRVEFVRGGSCAIQSLSLTVPTAEASA